MSYFLVNFLLARICSDSRARHNQSIPFERTNTHYMLYSISEPKMYHVFPRKIGQTFVWATLKAYAASIRWHNAAGYQIQVITVGYSSARTLVNFPKNHKDSWLTVSGLYSSKNKRPIPNEIAHTQGNGVRTKYHEPILSLIRINYNLYTRHFLHMSAVIRIFRNV